MDRAERIAAAMKSADIIRVAWPEKAAEIDALIAQARGDTLVDVPKVQVSISATLEKFDGEIGPDSTPVEVIHLDG